MLQLIQKKSLIIERIKHKKYKQTIHQDKDKRKEKEKASLINKKKV